MQSFVWMQVLLEHRLLQVKTFLRAFSCTRLLSEHRWQALDSCLSQDAIAQFVLWWPAVGIAGWPCQPPALPAAGTVPHVTHSAGDSILRSGDSRCQWQGVSIFKTWFYLFLLWKCLLDTWYGTAWDVALSPKRLMWMGFTCSFINSSKPR